MPIPQGPFSPYHQQRWIEAINVGSSTIPAYGICQITESTRPESSSAFTPSGGRTALSVQVPDSSTYLLTFAVNGPKPIAAGKPGEVTMHFPCYVAYNTANGTPAYGEGWGFSQSTSLATKNRHGLVIVGDPDGTIVRVDRVSHLKVHGKLDGTLNESSTATFSIYTYVPALAEWTDTLYNIPVRDFFLGPGESWDASTRGLAIWDCGTWVLDQASCSPDSGGGGGSGGGGSPGAQNGLYFGIDFEDDFYPGGTDYENTFDPFINDDTLIGA